MKRKLLVALSLVTACEGDTHRQERTVCDSCVIELRHVASLDFSVAPFMPSMFVNVERLHDGTFVVTDRARANTEILHFSATGRYIDSHLRSGEGPGEASSPGAFLASGDSLWVLDAGLLRCSLLDPDFRYVRGFQCIGQMGDVARIGGSLLMTGSGPMGLVEYDADGERAPARTEGDLVPFSDDLQSLASDGEGVWFVNHPNRYRLTYWKPGGQEPSKSIERNPSWWKPVEKLLMTKGPGDVGRVPKAEQRQVMSGPLLFNVGVSDGFVWTASYVHTRPGQEYIDFLNNWLDQGIAGDVRVYIEALTPEGELVASMAHDDMSPPRFTEDGLLYTLTRQGYGTGVTVYEPKVVGIGDQP